MATYYRWRQSVYVAQETQSSYSGTLYLNSMYLGSTKPSSDVENGIAQYNFTNSNQITSLNNPKTINGYFAVSQSPSTLYKADSRGASVIFGGTRADISSPYPFTVYQVTAILQFVSYVYSTSASAYPNGGMQGDYYYDQRTTISSPTAPTNLTYPNPITTPTVTVSWQAATSNTNYPVTKYQVSGKPDSAANFSVIGETEELSLSYDVGSTTFTTIQFQVKAIDSNGAYSSGVVGPVAQIILAPTLTVPSIAMQNQPITINWSAVDTATSYTLQRKADTDDDWVQVYSGDALTFTETAGEWTSVQYQVQAVFSSGAGGWATSASIPVVSSSALVISGTDEDLGTLTADIPYTVSTDTGNPITLTRTVNGVLVASLTVQNGFAYNIPVMDLPTGTGTIVISATVQATSGPVTATRTWTYTKAAFSFPGTGSTAQLQQEGANIFPATLAECVRVGANLGGNLGLALQALANSVQYNPETGEVTIPGGGVAPIPRIETGSYVGTGTSGSSNPNNLTFGFVPKLVFIYNNQGIPSFGLFICLGTDGSLSESSPSYGLCAYTGSSSSNVPFIYGQYGKYDVNETTLSWYGSSSTVQLNNGVTYYYVAIG